VILTKRIAARDRIQRDEQGQGLVEYALLLALISVACLVAVGSFGQTTVRELWGPIQDTLLPALGLR
jgi:Flp pilus assembly pilin Flp